MSQDHKTIDADIDFYAAIDNQFLLNESIYFDFARNQLCRHIGGESVPIKPICSRLLLVLCRYPGRVLSRQFLYDALWKNEGMVVSDNSLNQAICHLRTSFAQLDPYGVYVKTLPRIGYAMLATVSQTERKPRASTETATAHRPSPLDAFIASVAR